MDNQLVTIDSIKTTYVEAYGRVVALECDDTLFDLPYLPFNWLATPPSGTIDRRYSVARTGESAWEIAIDDQPSTTLSDASLIAEYIEGDLHHWLATYTTDFLFVHAGCVSWRDRAIVIPGRSYAGKTTLTQALLEAGAVYYSDDYAVIDADGTIHAFPRQLRVRSESIGPSRLVDPVSSNWPVGRDPIRAGVVAALTYDAELGWDVATLSRGMGALSLLDNTVAARERPEDALRLMSRAVFGAISIKGTRDSATNTAQRLIAMVDDLLKSAG